MTSGMTGSVEERIHKRLRVKGHQVLYLFSNADETNGQAKLAHDGDDDAALGRAVELGEHDAGDADGRGKLARLGEVGLTGGSVHYQQHVLWRGGNEFCSDAPFLAPVGH